MPGTHELDTRSKLMKAHAPPRFAVKRIETGVSYRERCSRLVLRSALSIRRLGAQQKKKDTFVTPLWRYALTLYFFHSCGQADFPLWERARIRGDWCIHIHESPKRKAES